MNTTGSFHSAASESASWAAPWLTAPSPKKQRQTRPSPRYLRGEGHARGQRQVAADDAVAAQEVVLGVEEVHRAAQALRAAGLLAEQLGHDRPGRHALGVGLAVVAVGRDDVVLGLERGHRARRRPPPARCRGAESRRSCPASRPSPTPPRCGGWPASGGSTRAAWSSLGPAGLPFRCGSFPLRKTFAVVVHGRFGGNLTKSGQTRSRTPSSAAFAPIWQFCLERSAETGGKPGTWLSGASHGAGAEDDTSRLGFGRQRLAVGSRRRRTAGTRGGARTPNSASTNHAARGGKEASSVVPMSGPGGLARPPGTGRKGPCTRRCCRAGASAVMAACWAGEVMISARVTAAMQASSVSVAAASPTAA